MSPRPSFPATSRRLPRYANMAHQKSPRAMILDRFAAGYINIDTLAIEEAADSVRVTGSVQTEEERQRVLTVLGEAQAEGIRSTHKIEVRPTSSPNENAASISDIRNPPEPA
jgi:hypothetical protein